MNHSFRIALVEDDIDLLHSIQEYLSLAGFSVWGVGSAEAFFRRFVADPVEVVLLDIGLPGEDGLSVAELLKTNAQVAVIILSARDGLEDRLAGMHAGADRYMVKPINFRELSANINAVVKRTQKSPESGPVQPPHQVLSNQSLQWQLDVSSWLLTSPKGLQLHLNAREFALMHMLIKVPGQTVQRKDIAHEIFGSRITNSFDRLNVLITRLRKKAIDALGEPLPIKTAHQIGYAFTAPAELN